MGQWSSNGFRDFSLNLASDLQAVEAATAICVKNVPKKHCMRLLVLVCLASIAASASSYSEYNYDAPARYDTRRGGRRGTLGGTTASATETGSRRLRRHSISVLVVATLSRSRSPPMAQQPTSREYLQRAHEVIADREKHKCRIWVP